MYCLFVSDLHGRGDRYRKLFELVRAERPDAVFLGGDLFPRNTDVKAFMEEHFFAPLRSIPEGTEVFSIMGNDDRRDLEHLFIDAEDEGLLHHMQMKKAPLGKHFVRGYSFVPPSPFRLKDWEKRDRPGEVPYTAIPPEEGIVTVEMDRAEMARASIKEDLDAIGRELDLPRTILLCHAPPYGTALDKVGYESTGFDPHVGSRSVREFIERAHPLISLHGHIHESTTVTRHWMDKLGTTICVNGATEGPQLCLVRFDTDDPSSASRELI